MICFLVGWLLLSLFAGAVWAVAHWNHHPTTVATDAVNHNGNTPNDVL